MHWVQDVLAQDHSFMPRGEEMNVGRNGLTSISVLL